MLPYVYDAQAAETNIITAIDEMAQGAIDAIALTSSGQVRRLIEVAQAHGCEARLREGLTRTPIASVGPVVSDELESHGLRTDISPANDAYFMKPLISAMAAALGKTPPRSTCHCERSETIQHLNTTKTGLLRRFAPRNDEIITQPFASFRSDTPDTPA